MEAFDYVVDGVRLHAVAMGEGPLVVLLHGGGGSHHALLATAGGLAGRHKVVLPDLRGSGRSWFNGALSWDRLAADVAGLLDHLGAARAVIGGASMGSGVALRFALDRPERVERLMLLQPVYDGVALAAEQAEPLAAFAEAVEGAADMRAVRPFYEAKAYFDAVSPGWDLASLRATARFMAAGSQPFGPGELARLRMPVLVAAGDDAMHPASVARLYLEQIAEAVVSEDVAAFCA